MLDLKRYDHIRLHPRPPTQRLILKTFMGFAYDVWPGVEVAVEGAERIPDEPVIFAMNHTADYGYSPFLHWLLEERGRSVAAWVKPKLFEQRGVGFMMEVVNAIPVVSRGYLITRDFMRVCERRPTDQEYRRLRDLVDRVAQGEAVEATPGVGEEALFGAARDILGQAFDPASMRYPDAINLLFQKMMRRVVALSHEARVLGLDLLIFPEGSRSTRLSRGHTGVAQVALDMEVPVVPVGCNGSDRIHPKQRLIPKPGRVVYRVGAPLWPDRELAAYRPDDSLEPFSLEAEREHGERFQALTDEIMGRINAALDPRYRAAEGSTSDGVSGVDRFI